MKKILLQSVLLGLSGVVISGCGSDSGSPNEGTGTTPITAVSVSKSISNDTPAVTLKNSAGISVWVPQGAIPKAKDGSNQPLVVSIEEKTPPVGATLPEGFKLKGKTWLIGPENFVFSDALVIGLPYTPEEGMAYRLLKYNGENNRWETVSTLDSSGAPSGTQKRAIAFTPRQGSYEYSTRDIYGTAYKVGLYGLGYKTYQTVAEDPKKTGIVTLVNTYTNAPKRFIKYCLNKSLSSIQWPDQHINDYGSGGPGIIGDGGDLSAVANLELPQGQYAIQIERSKGTTTDREHHAECDGWFEVNNVGVTGQGGIYYKQGSRVVKSDAKINITDNQPWQEGCAPCSSAFPAPSALYGVGNLGATLTWQDRNADLDLHLLVPSTTPTDNNLERIYFDHDESTDGIFKLDIDRECENINEGDLTENIFSKAGEHMPAGRYSVGVRLYGSCDGNDLKCVDFNVRMVVNGKLWTHSDKVCPEDIGPDGETQYKEVTNFRFEK